MPLKEAIQIKSRRILPGFKDICTNISPPSYSTSDGSKKCMRLYPEIEKMPEQKPHSGTARRYRLIISNSAAAPIIARETEPLMLTAMSPLTDNSSNTIGSRSSRGFSNGIRLSSLFTGTLPAPASAGRVPCFSSRRKFRSFHFLRGLCLYKKQFK